MQGNVIVVDDSTDFTKDILGDLADKIDILSLIDGDNMGFGAAIRKGISNSTGKFVIVMMGDGSEDPSDLVAIVEKLNEGYGVVFGNRFFKSHKRKDYPKVKYWANRAMNIALRIIFHIKSRDITNAFTGYNLDKLNEITLESNGFELSIEIPIRMIKNGASYTSVNVVWINRIEGDSKMRLLKVGRSYWNIIFKILLGK